MAVLLGIKQYELVSASESPGNILRISALQRIKFERIHGLISI